MFLSNTLPTKEDDFQDYKLWRTINYEILKNLDTEFEVIIVPMTITNLQYYDEIVGKLKRDCFSIKHFILITSKENIISRLNARGNSTEYGHIGKWRDVIRLLKIITLKDRKLILIIKVWVKCVII